MYESYSHINVIHILESVCIILHTLTRSELDSARVAYRAAEDLAERRSAEVKKLQQAALGAEALRKYQDICLVRCGSVISVS